MFSSFLLYFFFLYKGKTIGNKFDLYISQTDINVLRYAGSARSKSSTFRCTEHTISDAEGFFPEMYVFHTCSFGFRICINKGNFDLHVFTHSLVFFYPFNSFQYSSMANMNTELHNQIWQRFHSDRSVICASNARKVIGRKFSTGGLVEILMKIEWDWKQQLDIGSVMEN